MPQGGLNILDVVLIAAAIGVTVAIGGAVLYWVDQEWRQMDRREPPPNAP